MKAIVYTRYGTPDVLHLKEVPKPVPKDHEVLIKLCASSINSWDWDLVRGKPYIYRILFGLLKPKFKIIGCDIAGRVEATGKNVKQFRPGDEVFGDISASGWGGFAEYVSVNENALTPKPAGMTFEQAAATPQAGLLALQGLRDKRQIQPGDKVLINGAGGGVGTFAVQIAKMLGAEVTGVDHTNKLDALRSVGADFVIDYTKEDFTRNGRHYDLVLDVNCRRSILDCRKSLNTGGAYVIIGGSVIRLLQFLFLLPMISINRKKKICILAHKPNKYLEDMIKLFESGKVLPVIDRCFSLPEVPEAFRYFGKGEFKGKVVITMR